MSDERVQSALAIFREACELPEAERASFLDSICGQDTELRTEVESMLAWDGAEDTAEAPHPVRAALADLVQQAQSQQAGSASTPETVGGYRIIRLIAHGGMGVVYEAQQENPLRRVAIKLARVGGTTTERARRFEQEAQLLARLSHPGIAQIIEAGTTSSEAGAQPFFAMELVAGQPLTDHASAHLHSTREKLELMVRVCEPVVFAHERGVIHRDLKPDNILIDASGAPKVLDFGVAKVEAAGGFDAVMLRTEAGRVIGTLGYMAPEQLGGVTDELTPAADVYSLGVIIYELLTGGLPHQLDAVRLTHALAVLSSTDAPLLGVVRPDCRGDLEAIVAKALEKESHERYPDAAALRADIERYLHHEPVQARRHSTFHRVRKFSRRHRGLVGGVAATIAALLLGLLTALFFLGRFQDKVQEFDQIAQVVRYENLIDIEKTLYPAWPYKVEAIEEWLAEYGKLFAMRASIEQTIEDIQARAQPLGEGPQFLLDSLTELLKDPERLAAEKLTAVENRLFWAKNITELTNDHPNARASWAEVHGAIASSEKYKDPSIDLEPQTGLVPIGENPKTGLWEFYHLHSSWDGESDPRTIAIPEFQEDGSIAVFEGMGIVFVLIPGGKFLMGAQKADENNPNYDPNTEPFEGAPHPVELDPYFLSKFELTQGQWSRLSGGESTRLPEKGTKGVQDGDTYPVTWVSWPMCTGMLTRFQLTLPTEAQWERGCRGGTSTPWSSGVEADSLEGFANVRDQTANEEKPKWPVGEAFDDGFTFAAPVGSYDSNPFGLHDMHGNVLEWVRDGWNKYSARALPRDGERARGPKSILGVGRGGSFQQSALDVRSSRRENGPREMRTYILGVRAARALHHSE